MELNELAQEVLDNFEYVDRTVPDLERAEDSKKFWRQKKPKEWITNLCMKAHGDRMPSDDIYEVIVEALELIAEANTEDEARDYLTEITTDDYTSDLTKWLNRSVNNVYYLTEAIEEGSTDGFKALILAQYRWKQEIANVVLDGLIEELENREEV